MEETAKLEKLYITIDDDELLNNKVVSETHRQKDKKQSCKEIISICSTESDCSVEEARSVSAETETDEELMSSLPLKSDSVAIGSTSTCLGPVAFLSCVTAKDLNETNVWNILSQNFKCDNSSVNQSSKPITKQLSSENREVIILD